MANTHLFVFIVCFWTILTLLSNVLGQDLLVNRPSEIANNLDYEKDWITQTFDTLDDVPMVNVFVPLLKILTFSTTSVPPYLTIILDMMAIFSAYVFVGLIRGNN